MYCQKCGTQNADTVKFCVECGTPFNPFSNASTASNPNVNPIPQEVYQAPVQIKKKKKKGLNAVLIIIGFAIAIAVAVNQNGINPQDASSSGGVKPIAQSSSPRKSSADEAKAKLKQAQDLYAKNDVDSAWKIALEARLIEKLPEIEEFIQECKVKKLELFSKLIDEKLDDMEGITWVHYKGQSNQIKDFTCQAYIGLKDGYTPSLRFLIGFNEDNWLFMESIKFKNGDNEFSLSVSFNDRKTEVGFGTGVFEWIDIKADEALVTNFQSILGEGETKVRISGDQYHKDYTLSESQKERLRVMIDYYEIARQ